MAWVREHDGEALDPKVGALSDLEYRELHALRQYVAREHPGAAGIFTEGELLGAFYASPKGPRSVRPATLARFLELGLVRRVDSYSRAELEELEGERTNARVAYSEAVSGIREAGSDELRFNRWEHYNGAGDRTNAQRQARFRARLRGDTGATAEGEDNSSRNSLVTASAHARPVPSRPVTLTTTGAEGQRKGAPADERADGDEPGSSAASSRAAAWEGLWRSAAGGEAW